MHCSRKSPLKGLPQETMPLGRLTWMILEIAFKRVADVCKKQCLQVGLTCTILDVAIEKVVDVCKKQCL